MKRLSLLALLVFVQFMLPAAALAEEPVYTGFFSSKAVSGYDTVAYFTQGKPVEGNKDYQARYMGADWYFVSQKNLETFLADPTAYAPQYGGYCAWAIAAENDFAPGDPEYWSIVDGKLYLNYDAEIQQRWQKNRAEFIATGDKNWPVLLSK